ncbi:membrane protein [Kiloniella spongiae]|uniref:Membrane protein n=1 Tax=Kiloniella spongiae TaxID=1489064 RepID=A0A0H2MIA2_9PROT|nr:DUF2269 domain-containing protein [Kiloniella spongiae]KLN60462.1 membrane protein [Kiloniella spongiae]
MDYDLLKWIHILSSTILFGTGIGSAFYMFMANRSRDLPAMYFAVRHVVIADWLFTTPSVIVQLLSGIGLIIVTGYSLSDTWVLWGVGLYLGAGICWLPVVWIQIRMRELIKTAIDSHTDVATEYWMLDRWWILLGSLAFPMILVVFYLMVFKPG